MSTKAATRRHYSDREKLEALAAYDQNGGNLSQTAREMKVPIKTLAEWRDGRVSMDVADTRAIWREELSARLETMAHDLLDALPGKIESASLKDVVNALAVIIDRMLLLRREPTIISLQQTDRARMRLAIDEFMREAEANGEKVTRADAIKYLKPYLPDIQEHDAIG